LLLVYYDSLAICFIVFFAAEFFPPLCKFFSAIALCRTVYKAMTFMSFSQSAGVQFHDPMLSNNSFCVKCLTNCANIYLLHACCAAKSKFSNSGVHLCCICQSRLLFPYIYINNCVNNANCTSLQN